MTMNEIIASVLLSILIYFEVYAIINRICICIERCKAYPNIIASTAIDEANKGGFSQ